jgi:hypothetical protein
MDGEEAKKMMARAQELRQLAELIKTEKYRTLLLESAESFERLAEHILRSAEA